MVFRVFLLGFLCTWSISPCLAHDHTPGIVIEGLPKTPPVALRLKPGDIVTGWRLPKGAENQAPPTVFEFLRMLEGDGLIVPVALHVVREGKPVKIELLPNMWRFDVRPSLDDPFREPYARGLALVVSGQVEQGMGAWQELLDRADLPAELACWLAYDMGQRWMKQRKWDKALEAYDRAWASAPHDQARIAIMDARRLGFLRARKLDKSIESSEAARALIRRHDGEGPRYARQTVFLGRLLQRTQSWETAWDTFEEGIRIYRPLGKSMALSYALNYQGGTAWYGGAFKKAEERLREALAIREALAPDSMEPAKTLHLLAGLSTEIGDLAQAQQYMARALELSSKVDPGSMVHLNFLSSMGLVTIWIGDFEYARDLLLQAKDGYKGSESEGLAAALHNLALAYQNLKDYENAEKYYLESIRIAERTLTKSEAELMTSHLNLGIMFTAAGDFEKSEGYLKQALASLKGPTMDLAKVRSAMGSLYLRQEKWAEAASYYRQSLKIAEDISPESKFTALVWNRLALSVQNQGQMERAGEYFERSRNAMDAQIVALGGTLLQNARYLSQEDDIYRNYLTYLVKAEKHEAAFELLETLRARNLRGQLGRRRLSFEKDEIPAELLAALKDLGSRYDRLLSERAKVVPENRAEIERLDAARRELRVRHGQIVVDIHEAAPRTAAIRHPRPLKLEEVRAALDESTVLLSYAVMEERTFLFVLNERGLARVVTIERGSEDLAAQVRDLHTRIKLKSGGAGTRRLLDRLCRDLYGTLIAPIAPLLVDAERLLVVPDGPLHTLPFNVLIMDPAPAGMAEGRHLVAWKPVTKVESATIFAMLKAQKGPEGSHLAAFGNPKYPSPAVARNEARDLDARVRSAMKNRDFAFEPLPYSEREVMAISKLFRDNVSLYLGAAAIEEKTKSLGPETTHVHFACHAGLDNRFPMDSYLALTIPTDGKDKRDNGLLQVWEIYEQLRLHADLVVLSGCETALGKDFGGEGLLGLTQAFQYAGARSVVASLWAANDLSTSLLMEHFYRFLDEGLAKDEALRRAQLELIRGPVTITDADGESRRFDASHPYYWGAFQLIGPWN